MKNLLILSIVGLVLISGYMLVNKSPSRGTATTGENIPPATTATTTTITDPVHRFTLSYPTNTAAVAEEVSGTLVVGEPAVRVNLNSSFFEKTNLSEAAVIVGTSSTTVATAACLKAAPGEKATSTRGFDGTSFKGFYALGAAAGNRYDVTSYRALIKGTCYEIQKLMHYGVFENYEPGSVTEFNRDEIDSKLTPIADSFKFI